MLLFCLEMNWHYVVMYVRSYRNYCTPNIETKMKYLYILVRFMFFVEYCYNIDTIIYFLHSPPYSRYFDTTFNYVALQLVELQPIMYTLQNLNTIFAK